MESLSLKYSSQTDNAVYTNKKELSLFLHLLDSNPIIQKFLHYDSCFRLADKYLIAMVFIYFKRAQLSPEDYTYLNFFAGLCLAHSMEEDVECSSEIYFWALGDELKKLLPYLLHLKVLLWEAMDYRAVVSHHCCKQLISVSQDHPVWQRERSSLHLKLMPSPSLFKSFSHYSKNSKQKQIRKVTNKLSLLSK